MADGDDYKPKQFTPEQRELLGRVRILNRDRPSDFAEAEDWIATPPESAEHALQRYRAEVASEIARRRERRDRSWLVAPSFEMEEDWRRWPEGEAKAKVLALWRSDRALTIRSAFARFRENIRDELERGPLQPYQSLDRAAHVLTVNDRPVFDGLAPRQKVLWARRVLRVAWIMTDTAPLDVANREWLREWQWGEHPLEFLVAFPDGDAKLIPRVYARVEILDEALELWEALVRDALGALDEAAAAYGAGARVVPLAPPPPAAPAILDAEELNILKVLNRAATLFTQYDIEAQTSPRLGRNTISRRLGKLRELRLAHQPKGERGGHAITDEGRAYLKRSDKSIE